MRFNIRNNCRTSPGPAFPCSVTVNTRKPLLPELKLPRRVAVLLELLKKKIFFHKNRRSFDSQSEKKEILLTASSQSTSSTPLNSVSPHIDGVEVFLEIAKLIHEAKRWCYIVVWGYDEEVRLSDKGQNDVSAPTSVEIIKQKAMEMFASGITPDIKVLIWNGLLDDDYSEKDGANDVGNLSVITLRWVDISQLSDKQFLEYMRNKKSAAEEGLLLYLFHQYRDIETLGHNGESQVHFPTGIHVALQRHPMSDVPMPSMFDGLSKSLYNIFVNLKNKMLSYIGLKKYKPRSIMGSHHQKFVLTEKGCYIGGLNFQKDYWDSHSHLLIDDRRASSEKKHTGNVRAMHDTGTIVQGPVIENVMKTFALRWDQAIKKKGGYDYLTFLLKKEAKENKNSSDRKKYKKISQYISTLRPFIYERQVTQGAQYDTTCNPDYRADEVLVKETLPANSSWAGPEGVTDIFKQYKKTISMLTAQDSFLYMENQYFNKHEVAEVLYKQWHSLEGYNGPFAYIVLTYNPGTSSLDEKLGGIFFKDNLIRSEMQNLKWLEIKSAREILVKDKDGMWVPTWGIQDPRKDIEFVDNEINGNPKRLKDDSKFIIRNAVKLSPVSEGSQTKDATWLYRTDENGIQEPDSVPKVTLRVDEILTVSDIMAYTLVSSMESKNKQNLPKTFGTPDQKYRNFITKSNIYIHSKCSIFLNCQPDNCHWATIGSANMSPHSLEFNRQQDSEMNVWWKQNKGVKELAINLWKEHLEENDIKEINPDLWREKGWNNLVSIMNGKPLDGTVLRLDVVDRCKHLT